MTLGSSPVDPDAFFTWTGKCITAWANVEDHLFEICLFSLGCTRDKAAIVYYKTPNLDARLSLTDELLRTVLPPRERESGGHDHQDVKYWNETRLTIIDMLSTRNRLAHHPVEQKKIVPVFIKPDGTQSTDAESEAVSSLMTFSWYESYVSEAEKLRGRHENLKPLTTPDLSSHRVEIESLKTRLEIFRVHVLPKYAK
jgi:hypothetical protein